MVKKDTSISTPDNNTQDSREEQNSSHATNIIPPNNHNHLEAHASEEHSRAFIGTPISEPNNEMVEGDSVNSKDIFPTMDIDYLVKNSPRPLVTSDQESSEQSYESEQSPLSRNLSNPIVVAADIDNPDDDIESRDKSIDTQHSPDLYLQSAGNDIDKFKDTENSRLTSTQDDEKSISPTDYDKKDASVNTELLASPVEQSMESSLNNLVAKESINDALLTPSITPPCDQYSSSNNDTRNNTVRTDDISSNLLRKNSNLPNEYSTNTAPTVETVKSSVEDNISVSTSSTSLSAVLPEKHNNLASVNTRNDDEGEIMETKRVTLQQATSKKVELAATIHPNSSLATEVDETRPHSAIYTANNGGIKSNVNFLFPHDNESLKKAIFTNLCIAGISVILALAISSSPLALDLKLPERVLQCNTMLFCSIVILQIGYLLLKAPDELTPSVIIPESKAQSTSQAHLVN